MIRLTVLTALVATMLSACATLPRIEYSTTDQIGATVVGMPPGIRAFADAPLEDFATWFAGSRTTARRSGAGANLLALSGGAEDGAYGAGFLNGWSERGTRPTFAIVSGISTGALIAPYAFLGEAYDEELKAIFTEVEASDIFAFRGLRGLFGSALTDSAPLRSMVDREVTPELLTAIAAESRKGRLLIVGTTNLDAQRTVVWNMGRIAEVGTPRALELFRDVLIASASVPALFPPVLIDARAGSGGFQELHVDGGATTQIFTFPNAVLAGPQSRRPPPGSKIVMIVNNKLAPDFEVVPARTIPLAARSFSTMIKASARQTVLQTYDFAHENDIDFQLTFIGDDFDAPYPGPFDRDYMNALYAYGYERGRLGNAWITEPLISD